MKPYILAAYNIVKFNLIKLFRCSGLSLEGVLLTGFNTRLSVKRSSVIVFGKLVISDGRLTIIADDNALIEIGSCVYFNEGCMISSKSKVQIGEGCQFGPNVKIFDNDHCYSAVAGLLSMHTSAPIVIGKNCWIAANVTILKGATIGDNCVIGAGTVVKGEIPDGSIVTQERKLHIRSIETGER